MVPIPALAGRPVFQIAVVVRDFEQALARYSSVLGAGPWRCWTLGADDHEETSYRGAPTRFSSLLALNDSMPQLELIQPLTGPSAHQEWLEQHGEGPHHLGIVVDSVDETIAQMTGAGYQLIHTGARLGPRRDGAWAYFDTTETLGLVLEAVEPPTSMPPPDYLWPGAHAPQE